MMMDSDCCVVNAEINMQELESTRSVDFQRSNHADSGASVIAGDLAYIMQSTFIHPIEVNNSSSSDQDTSEVSEDDSRDSDDDDVRITLVKDKNTVTPKDNEQGCLNYSGDESLSSETETGRSTLLSIIKGENRVVNHIPRVPNEVLPGELTVDVEDIVLTPKDHLNQLGIISGVVEKMVVVQSNKDAPALDGESAFFFEDRSYLGKVFDTFGPVKVPYYTVHLSGKLDVSKLSVGTKVYYVPFNQKITKYVFLEQLRKMKGSDASWRDDCEPPVAYLDYSDDDEERSVKNKSKSKGKPETSNSNMNKDQRKQTSPKPRGNRFNHSHSNNQNGQDSICKPGSRGPNPHPGQPILDSSINHQSINQLTQPCQPLPSIQPQFPNQKVFLQDSNATIVNQNSNIPAPTIRTILQPQIRLETKNNCFSIRPPSLNDFLLRGPNHMNQNMKISNGLFANSFPQQLPSPFCGLTNQQVIMAPQNNLFGRPQLPASSAPLHIQPAGVINNIKPLSDILPVNNVFHQPFIDSSVPVANRPYMTPIQPFGNCPPQSILTSNENNLRSQSINNFPSRGSNLHVNTVPFNSPQRFHDESHFSMNLHQDPIISRKKPEGIVKLNGFTFKI